MIKTEKIKSKLFELDNKIRKIYVVGDLHGDFLAYQSIIHAWEKEKEAFIVFLGDYADRGRQGLEILESLMTLKENERVIALKGNHEDYSITGKPKFSPCSLIDEVEEKRGNWPLYFRNKLHPFFQELHVAALLPGKVLFVHGGISSRITSIESLVKPSPQVEEDILWSDPVEGSGEYHSNRGVGVEFGPDITNIVLERLSVKQIVRSHQPYLAQFTPYYSHGRKTVTISSTAFYGGMPFYLEINNSIDDIQSTSVNIG
jgi:serine/threonine-protein phosphatase PP1 catalytic subunit